MGKFLANTYTEELMHSKVYFIQMHLAVDFSCSMIGYSSLCYGSGAGEGSSCLKEEVTPCF